MMVFNLMLYGRGAEVVGIVIKEYRSVLGE